MDLAKQASTLDVKVQPSYPVFVGKGVSDTLATFVQASRVALLSDETVYELHGEALTQSLRAAGKIVSVHTFPPGEGSKSAETFASLLRQLITEGLDRKSAVIALGGGVTGDLSGFVAASFMRGIDFYQVPTSLLAMVDASVGGKTGINLPEGKNLVGAFWQPKAVFVDTQYLRTLPEKLFKDGAAEHLKHGLLADARILEDVKNPNFKPDGDTDFLAETLARSIQVKADVVAADEKEAGQRAHLNLGHTLAHALESASHHALSHGEAVAYGLVFNAKLAAQRGYSDETKRTLDFLRYLAPKPVPKLSLDELLPYMRRDKKTDQGALRFVLLREIGKPFIAADLEMSELAGAWHFVRSL